MSYPHKVGKNEKGELGELSEEFPFTDSETEALVLLEDGRITRDDGVDATAPTG